MAKITLSDVSNILGNPTSAANTINANNDLIEQALDLLVSRDGESPNQMAADVDLNHNDIINVDNIHASILVLNGEVVTPDKLESVPPDSNVFDPKRQKDTVTYFGAKGDGVTDDTLAFANAISQTDFFKVPTTDNGYKVSSKLTIPGGKHIEFEPGAKLVFQGSFVDLIEFSGDNTTIENLSIDFQNVTEPSASTTPAVRIKDRSRIFLENFRSQAGPLKQVTLLIEDSSYCQVTGQGEVLDTNSTAIILRGPNCHDNILSGIRFKGTDPGLHILLETGAHHNLITGCRADDGGAELVGLRYDTHDNLISNNIAFRCEDAGYSISGYNNLVIGNTAEECDFNGFAIFGRDNLIIGNIAKNNGKSNPASGFAGFSILSNFGGIASGNYLSGNFADDDQTVKSQAYLAKVSGDSYAEWSSGVSITVGTYRSYLDNLYIAASAGTTGGVAPIHTTGTVSDGGVNWTWINSQSGGMQSVNNYVEVFGTRFGISEYLNTSNGYQRFNVGSKRASASILTTTPVEHQSGQSVSFGDLRYVDPSANNSRRFYQAISGGTTGATPLTHTSGSASDGGVTWYYMGTGGEFEQGVSSNKFPIFKGGVTLDALGSQRNIILVNQSPEGLVSASPGSLAIRNTGTTLLGLYVKNSGTGSTGWLPLQPVISGTTANRPALSGAGYTGFQYFDTTLGKPIWWNGSAWADATGTLV